MRRQVLIALLCAGGASCIQFGVERPPLHRALLANHAQHLSLVVHDADDVLRIELEGDYWNPSWCPRFSLEVTVNGEPAEQVEDAAVVAAEHGCASGKYSFRCALPAFEYHFDPSEQPEALRIEVSDRSATLAAEAKAPTEVAHVELDRDVVKPGERLSVRLTPEPAQGSQGTVSVNAPGDSLWTEFDWQGGDLSVQIPTRATPGDGFVNVAVSDWVPLSVSCEGAKDCRIELYQLLRAEERWQTQAPFTVQ